jgi:TonB-linked SusC/RagA family outer membrane protein
MKKKYHDFLFKSLRHRLVLMAGILWLTTLSVVAQQTAEFTGVVSDKQGETLPGVSVVIKGTTHGTATDIQGKFKLAATETTVDLVFSFVGYVTQEVKAVAGIPLKVTLSSSTVGLSELVVIGYGTQKKSVVTGAISKVKSSDLDNMPIVRVEQALQGRTSGVSVAASSGQPGASSTVKIRGTTTINNSNPLYVIDGLPIDVGGIDYLNSEDIESIEVLKDAASAAIYGTRAASGVILVTTKKGKSGSLKVGSGSMSVNFNAYFGTQAPAKKLDLLNATDYAKLRNEAAENAGLPAVFNDPSSFGEGTDWQKTIFNNSAKIQNYDLSISGGNDKSTYYASVGYFSQEGVIATDISNYKKLNLRFNATNKINDWLRFGSNIGYTHIKSQGSLNTNSEYGGPLSSAINLDPITQTVITDPAIANQAPYNNHNVVRDANGNPYGISPYVVQEMTNPLAYIKTHLGNYGWSDNMVGNMYMEIEPLKGFKVKSDFGAKLAFYGDASFSPNAYLNASTSMSNSYYRATNQGFIWNWENTASYNRTFGKHNGTVLIGTSAWSEHYQGVNATYNNLPVNTFEEASMNFNIPASDRIGGGWETPYHRVSSLFARIIYNYNEKYLFTGIVRRDGSTRFGDNKKYGYFPSVSVGWVASREGFWPENKVVTFVKLRGSYGINGNDNIRDYGYVSTVSGGRNYTFGNDNYVIGYSPNAPANDKIHWEQTSQLDIGLEATFFNDLTMSFDWFNKQTTDMLGYVVVPGYVGTGNPLGNIGSVSNKGVELELGYHKVVGKFDLKFNGNVSYLKNEITDLGSVDYLSGATFQSSAYEISRNQVGHPYGAFYGFKVLDIFQSESKVQSYVDKNGNLIQPNAKAGDFKFADLNGDGKIDANDRTFIGDPTPTWSYGFTVNAAFMGFDILVFAQGVAGNDVFNGLRRLDIPSANWTSDALGRWTGPGTSSNYPRLVLGDPNGNFSKPSTFFLTSGAYFRFKTIQLGYTLPKAVVGKIGMQQLRVYVTANNLFTITKYQGYDPEIGGSSYGIDRGVYPQARAFMVGLSVTL